MLYIIIIIIIIVTFILFTCLTQPSHSVSPTSLHSVTFSESVFVCVFPFFLYLPLSFSVCVCVCMLLFSLLLVGMLSKSFASFALFFVRVLVPLIIYFVEYRVVLSHQRISKSIFVFFFYSLSARHKLHRTRFRAKKKKEKRIPCQMYYFDRT